MPYFTYSVAAKILAHQIGSTLCKVRKDGWHKHYEVNIEGKKYLNLNPRGRTPLDQYLKVILQWRPSNPMRKINYF